MSRLCAFTVYDENNAKYAQLLKKSFKKYHKEVEFREFGPDEIAIYRKADPQFFYRATPILMRQLFEEGYTHVGKIDADSIVVGDLDYVFNSEYEVGTVINWNRIDPKTYGFVSFATIQPQEYFNNGLIFTRSKEFVYEWWDLCHSPHFDRMPMREQDALNILTHYGRFITRCFDYPTDDYDELGWYGLIAKGEWTKAVIKGKDIVIPKGADRFPMADTKLKVIHFAEGNKPNKMNWKISFPDEVSAFIDEVVK